MMDGGHDHDDMHLMDDMNDFHHHHEFSAAEGATQEKVVAESKDAAQAKR